MKKLMSFLALALTISGIAHTQSDLDYGELSKVMELQMPSGSGTNGAGVAWNPVNKTYYAAYAGNSSFPLAVFDSKGNRISRDKLSTQLDVRGIWYNSKKNTIQVNGYKDMGWAEYSLDNQGLPTKLNKLYVGRSQPTDKSSGAFDEMSGLVYFLNDEGDVEFYDINTTDRIGKQTLYLNCESVERAKNSEKATEWKQYNQTTVMYTGIKDAEFALIFADVSGIVIYSKKTGLATKALLLPNDVPVFESMNVSYANGIFWLFDTDNRKWIGYR